MELRRSDNKRVHQCFYFQILDGHRVPFLQLISPENAERPRRGQNIFPSYIVESGTTHTETSQKSSLSTTTKYDMVEKARDDGPKNILKRKPETRK